MTARHVLPPARTSAPRDVARDRQQVADARTRLLAGVPVRPDRLPPRAARAVWVARESGAPAVPALDAASSAADHLRRRRRALDVATAQARTVAFGLSVLPVLAVGGLGALLDASLWRFYLTPTGAAVGGVGLVLVLVGAGVASHMVRRVDRPSPVPGRSLVAAIAVGSVVALIAGAAAGVLAATTAALWIRRRVPVPSPPPPGTDEIADLVATALIGGLPAPAALRLAAAVLPGPAPDLRRAALAHELGITAALPSGVDRIGTVLRTAARYGTPAAPALRRVAAELRDEELNRALAATERLPALLAFPTALCLMPACVLLVGAPLLAHGLAAAGGGT